MPRKGQTRGGGTSSGTEAPADMSAMMNLQMMKMTQKMNKKLGGESSTDSEDGERNNGDPDFTGITKMRKKFRAKPEVFLKEFASRTKSDLGVKDNRQVWRFADNGKRLRPVFGKMAGLDKTVMLFLEVVQLHHDKQPEQASALAVQACKALHQVALDKGSWENAQLLIPLEEVGERSKFGGDERELRGIYKYRKSLRELRTLGQGQTNKDEAVDEEETPAAVPAVPKKKGT